MKSDDKHNYAALIAEIKSLKEKMAESERTNKWIEESFYYNEQILIVINNANQIKYVSESVKNIMGYNPEELVGQDYSEIYVTTSPYADHKGTNALFGVSTTFRRSNGDLINFYITNNKSTFNGEEVTFVLLKLKHEDSFPSILQKVAEQAPDSIMITDKNSVIEYANQSAIDLAGYSREELIGQNPRIFQSGFTSRKVYDDLQKTLIDGNTWHGEFINKRKDGSIFIESAVISPIRDDNGQVSKYLAVKLDVTEKKKIQEALLLKEMAVEHAMNAIAVFDINGFYTYVNPAYQQLYGHMHEEIIGKHFSEIIYSVNVISKILQDLPKNEVLEGEGIIIRKDGEFRSATYHVCLLKDKDGNNIGSVWSVNDITERKEAEDKVLKYQQELEQIIEERTQSFIDSEKRFRTFFNQSNDLISVVSLDENNFGEIISANDTTYKKLGYSPDELIGSNIRLFCPDELVDTFRVKSQTLDVAELKQVESSLRASSGEYLPVEINASVINLSGEKLLLASVRDITFRKKAEEQIKLFSRALEQTSSLLMILDLNGNIQNINRAFTEITGYTLEEVYGRTPREVLTDSMSDEEREEMFASINSGANWKGEFLNKRKNGEPVWLSAAIAPLRNDDGEIIYFVAIEEDITEKKKQDTELRKLSQAIEKSNVSVIITDEKSTIEYVNPHFVAKSGFPVNEVIGKKPRLNSKFHTREYIENIKQTLIAGNIWHGELKNITKEGKVYWDQTTITPIKNDRDIISHYVAVQFEISELKKIQEELVGAKEIADSATKAKSEFIANMSHEIRTPMNAVLGYSELLHAMITEPVKKNYIESILLSGKNLLALINDILDLSKIEADKLELHYAFVNAQSFFKEFHRIFSLKLTEKDLELIIDFSSGFPNSIKIDEIRLRQILFNLIGNSVKFTHSGYIKLSVFYNNLHFEEESGEGKIELNIVVEDTGIGMSKEFVKNIFEPFAQASGNYGGTGLGLSITRKLVGIMGGSISVASELNEGSSFHLVIPNVKFTSKVIEIMQRPEYKSIKFTDLKMVVADNVRHSRTFIIDALTNSGIKIYEAEDGTEALSLVKEVKPDIVITDLRMPIMDGYELLAEIRKDDSLKNTIVIAYSASITNKQRSRLKDDDFDGSLVKPTSVSDLFNLLAQKFEDKTPQIQLKTDEPEDDFNGDDIIDIDELLNIFENELTTTWSSFKERQPIKEIKVFAERLIQAGEKHNSTKLQQYGEMLKIAAQNFNVKEIIKEIYKFPSLIEEHKKFKN